jgi:hypothetical protein
VQIDDITQRFELSRRRFDLDHRQHAAGDKAVIDAVTDQEDFVGFFCIVRNLQGGLVWLIVLLLLK